MSDVFCFEVSIEGFPDKFSQFINAHTRGRAKAIRWRSVVDAFQDTPFTAMRARKIGGPVGNEMFDYVLSQRKGAYPHIANMKVGDRVEVLSGGLGAVVGAGAGSNFQVLFDVDSPKYAGQTLYVHPHDIKLLEGK
jgi:hypothetical protein